MAGVYPGIAALCMMAKYKSTGVLIRKILLVFALLQIVAWGCDIYENYFLLKWINNPVIGNEFHFYHIIVSAKWIIALAGAFFAIPLSVRKNNLKNGLKTHFLI